MFGSGTEKPHIGWSNSRTVACLSKGKMTKKKRAQIKKRGVKSTKTYFNYWGQKRFAGSKALKSTGTLCLYITALVYAVSISEHCFTIVVFHIVQDVCDPYIHLLRNITIWNNLNETQPANQPTNQEKIIWDCEVKHVSNDVICQQFICFFCTW